MDLSKAYDCLPHDLIIAKLEAYELDKNSLSLVLDYLLLIENKGFESGHRTVYGTILCVVFHKGQF